MVTVVMGVSGCGKTTVGTYLAESLRVPFYDADDFHPQENVNRMKAGIPLDDDARRPWLEILAEKINAWNRTGGAVLACSALKESYRVLLRGRQPEKVMFLYLDGTMEQVAERMSERSDHFMPQSLLESQFAALEPPEDALSFSIEQSSADIAAEAAGVLGKYYAAV